MANSDATTSRLKLIKRSFRRIGIKNPSLTDLSNAVELLNDKVKEIDVDGKWLWAISNTPTALTLVANQRSYAVGSTATTINSSILHLERAELVEGTSLTPLRIIAKEESISTSLRENTGKPTLVFLERLPSMTNNKMHFFNTPNSAYSVQYYFRRRLFDFDLASDNPDFPQDWSQRLVKILSYELAPEYGIPLQEREILRLEMQSSLMQGQAANSEQEDLAITQPEYF